MTTIQKKLNTLIDQYVTLIFDKGFFEIIYPRFESSAAMFEKVKILSVEPDCIIFVDDKNKLSYIPIDKICRLTIY